MSKSYNKTNFHKHTFCIFKEVSADAISGLTMNYKSKSGSSYYFTDEGVYRLSNHWGRAANCKWRLDKLADSSFGKTSLGFAKWTDFYPDNDTEKLYFIEVDFEKNQAHFYHKKSTNYTSDKVLRTTSDTMKLIKQVRVLLEESAWAKYLNGDISALRVAIIQRLLSSTKSFQEIRRDFM
jgi:hypothetical protein